MKDEEHHMSKNFQSDITDIPTVQVSAMNKDSQGFKTNENSKL
jgi:hypothetical protein